MCIVGLLIIFKGGKDCFSTPPEFEIKTWWVKIVKKENSFFSPNIPPPTKKKTHDLFPILISENALFGMSKMIRQDSMICFKNIFNEHFWMPWINDWPMSLFFIWRNNVEKERCRGVFRNQFRRGGWYLFLSVSRLVIFKGWFVPVL